jgi:hypothetical protein
MQEAQHRREMKHIEEIQGTVPIYPYFSMPRQVICSAQEGHTSEDDFSGDKYCNKHTVR